MKFLSISFLFFVMSAVTVFSANADDYGLQINSYASLDSEATSLILNDGKPLSLHRKPLEFSFSLFNRQDRPFGCVLRMISQDGFSIDLMNTVDHRGEYRPQVVAGADYSVIPSEIQWNQWVDVRLSLNPKEGTIAVDYNGTLVNIHSEFLSKVKELRFAFGNCPFEGFGVNSVASVSVRDVKILSDGQLVRHWPLMRHSSKSTYDEVVGAGAAAINPVWIADESISLKSVYQADYDHFVDVVYDGEESFYIMCPDGRIDVRNIVTGEGSQIKPRRDGGISPSNAPNQSKWCNDDMILSYCIAQNRYGVYDLKTNRWDNKVQPDPKNIYWNVTTSWDDTRGSLYCFGGYGFFHFSNILRVFTPTDPESFKIVTLNKIAPRFFASSVVIGDSLYVFGGEGSRTGNQGIVEEYFYDLYRVNLDTFEESLIWESDNLPFGKFIPGENLVYDESEGCFYTTAITDDDFILVKLDVDDPVIEPMSLPAGVRIGANIQYSNLYRNKNGDALYALFIQADNSQSTKLDIMQIALPLRPVDEVIVAVSADEGGDKVLPMYLILLIVILSVTVTAAVVVYFIISKDVSRKRIKNLKDITDLEELYDFSRNSISILGHFHVRNRDGQDISSQFSPTLRKLLSILIIYTVKYKQGILGDKLNMLIWAYKPEGTASNNRNVYISRLRAVLEGIDGVSIVTKNKYLSISFTDEVLCDYRELMRLVDEYESEKDLSCLLSLVLRGPLLPNLEDEWVSEFKNEYSSMVLSFLNEQIDNPGMSESVRIRLADTIMLYDKLNERALKIKCTISHANGNIASAKESYDMFCREYASVIGEEYGVSFKQIIS